MVAIANTSLGKAMDAAHIQVYGWVNAGGNLSNMSTRPGGNAPVTVELQADAAGTAGAGDSQREQVRTTLQLPLNQWAVVAESGDQRRVLHLRVSAPD